MTKKQKDYILKSIYKLGLLDDWLEAAFTKKHIMKENEYIEFGKELNEVIGLLKTACEDLDK